MDPTLCYTYEKHINILYTRQFHFIFPLLKKYNNDYDDRFLYSDFFFQIHELTKRFTIYFKFNYLFKPIMIEHLHVI